ncbi:hypothetical protein [Streptomyces sp. NPDC053048]|uniref:hypothetical protein n=1 Tax=Streptomyces sp. NPDC053048 TaxID=3365694 RepID=UPI0037D0BF45
MTGVKKSAPKAAAAEAEATGGTITFDYNGLTFEVPGAPDDFPLAAIMADDEFTAISLMLGDEQWAAYMKTGPTLRDFRALVNAMSLAQGRDTDAGN